MSFRINATTVVNSDRSFTLGTATPGTPVTGMIRYNSSLAQFEVYNGTAWVPIISTSSSSSPLWAWGGNSSGQLADGTTSSRLSPVSVVGGFTDWVQIAAGDTNANTTHTVAIRANGTAWAWGFGTSGQLGDGTTSSRLSPVSVVGGFTDWVQISAGGTASTAGSASTAAIRANGTAWAWGFNGNGRLGDGTTTARSSPVSVVGGFTDWVQISAGGGHTVAIRTNGTAWAWGYNFWGQLGDGTTSSRLSPVSVVGGFTDWVQISAGGGHTVAIRANGTAWAWGENGRRQLGDGTVSSRLSPVSVVGGFTDWVQISPGNTHTAAVRRNGTAWCWGWGTFGRLGDGTTNDRASPVSVVGGFTDWVQIAAGTAHTVAIRANGTAWAWGRNDYGELGTNNKTRYSSPVSVVGGFTDWVQIATAKQSSAPHTVAIRAI